MSARDYENRNTDPLPLGEWERSLAAANVTMRAHVDADTFETMHHLIGADILVKSNSGFSDTASLYSAGLKLLFLKTREAQRQAFKLEPFLGEPGARSEFLCTLLAHLQWRDRRPVQKPHVAKLRLANAMRSHSEGEG